MNKIYMLTAMAFAGLIAASPASADLMGSQVSLTAYFPDLSSPLSSYGPVTVDGTVEFPSLTPSVSNVSIDVTGTQIIVTQNNNGALYTGASFNGFVLDFTGVSLLGVSADGSSDYLPIDVSLSGSQISLNFSGVSAPLDGSAIIDVRTQDSTPTGAPEPLTLSLFGAGLIGLYRTTRRRQTAR
jgi:hypothetical protein